MAKSNSTASKVNKTAKRTELVTPTKVDKPIAQAEAIAADMMAQSKKRKAMQKSADEHNPLFDVVAAGTISNCRQVLEFLRTATAGLDRADVLSSEDVMGLCLIYGTMIDALKRQELAL